MFSTVEAICKGSRAFDTPDATKKITSMLLKTNNRLLTNSGQEMKAKLQVIQQFRKKAENQVSPKTSNDFIIK